MEKENDKDDKKSDKQEKYEDKKEDKKAFFVQRLLAFVLDVLIVSFVASLLATPFVDMEKDEQLRKEIDSLNNSFYSEKIDVETYTLQYADLSYNMARNSGALSFISIIIEILYFVVFQIYNDGQTVGKKMMKIKVKSIDGQLTMNQMIYRSLIANFILFEMIAFALMTFGSRYVYLGGVGIFGLIQYIVAVISLFMVMYGKTGCAIHDKLAHTKVITIK